MRRLIDHESNYKPEIGSTKSFGIVFSIFFVLLFIYTFIIDDPIYYFLLISFLLLIISFFKPIIFYYPNIIWAKLGILIGLIVSPLIMLTIYIIVFIPIGIIFKILKIDLLDRNYNKKTKSYWKLRKESIQNFKNQF